ncbi:hypothetical protein K458DRAFT_487932 [Lentithecium fluviatile CBS 122367]|uniref:Uncharacterized protein n=1 Tax=Lentithecium fluviatile CBS 122367 TaxID=1168545 RepID=A0A6G1J155_9PLEO|nr:hypothetical protein K458DRAFT_487932 [Lentithecium fluviatile CBS 122367]
MSVVQFAIEKKRPKGSREKVRFADIPQTESVSDREQPEHETVKRQGGDAATWVYRLTFEPDSGSGEPNHAVDNAKDKRTSLETLVVEEVAAEFGDDASEAPQAEISGEECPPANGQTSTTKRLRRLPTKCKGRRFMTSNKARRTYRRNIKIMMKPKNLPGIIVKPGTPHRPMRPRRRSLPDVFEGRRTRMHGPDQYDDSCFEYTVWLRTNLDVRQCELKGLKTRKTRRTKEHLESKKWKLKCRRLENKLRQITNENKLHQRTNEEELQRQVTLERAHESLKKEHEIMKREKLARESEEEVARRLAEEQTAKRLSLLEAELQPYRDEQRAKEMEALHSLAIAAHEADLAKVRGDARELIQAIIEEYHLKAADEKAILEIQSNILVAKEKPKKREGSEPGIHVSRVADEPLSHQLSGLQHQQTRTY